MKLWEHTGISTQFFFEEVSRRTKEIDRMFWSQAGDMFWDLPIIRTMFKKPRDPEFGILNNPWAGHSGGYKNLLCKVCDNKPIGKCCGDVAYCSVKCQEKDWHTHEKDCKRKIKDTF